jgi:hypothetical protein
MTDSKLDRRSLLRRAALAGLALGFAPGSDLVSPAGAVEPVLAEQRYDAVLMLRMEGGPSQMDTWDPKPGSPNNVFTTIDLGVNDVYGKPMHVATPVRAFADLVRGGSGGVFGLGLLRSLHHAIGSHGLGEEHMNTFWSSPVARLYPPMSVVMQHYFSNRAALGVPSVLVGGNEQPLGSHGNDPKGSRLEPALSIAVNANPTSFFRPSAAENATRSARRRDLVQLAARRFARQDESPAAWRAVMDRADQISSRPAVAAAFDLTGKTPLPGSVGSLSLPEGDPRTSLLLAQELIKAGVPYVATAIGGHDTHTKNVGTVESLWGGLIGPAVSQLARNLAASGKRVLIVMGGEFGRSPDSTAPNKQGVRRDGRDHWSYAFSWALLSVNQPRFRTTAVGDTGPNGMGHVRPGVAVREPLIDPISPSALGGLIYRVMGFPVGDATRIPTSQGLATPVDRDSATNDFEPNPPVPQAPMTTPRLMRRMFR